MKGFLVLFGFVSMAMAGPAALLQATPIPNLQAFASASVSSSSSPQHLSLLRLLPNAPIGPDGRVLDTLGPVRLTVDGRILDRLEFQAQSRQQGIAGASPLLSATRFAQSLASVNPTGATSSSRVQLLDVPELNVARIQQQQAALNLRQNILLAEQSVRPWSIHSNGLPLPIGSNGQLIASPLLVL